jgi:predicted ABC-type ATPase
MTASQRSRPPRIVLIAGPNGAGKTTFAMEYLPNEGDCPNFLNADLIAAGLSPFDPDAALIRAGKIMLDEIQWRLDKNDDFAIESTLSGNTYVPLLNDCRRRGYEVRLIFLSLSTPELAINRVRSRVAQGGHDVSEEVIRRRFELGARNFVSVYQPLADCWRKFDNSGEQPRVVDQSLPEPSSRVSPCDDVAGALERAAVRALEIGRRTKTPVWAVNNGMIVNLLADEQSRASRGNEDTTLP